MAVESSQLVAGRAAGIPAPVKLLTDERLARMVGHGSEAAFATLYERYRQPLYRYCRSIVRDEFDAQDALQSTFTAALSALQRGQRDAPLRPWLFRIAHNNAISVLRKRRDGATELTDELGGSAPSAADVAGERARLAVLVADLQELPDRQRSALVMRELSGLSHEEIAVALGTTPGTAKFTIFEARQALLEFSEGRAMGCEEIRQTISAGDRRMLRGRRIRAHVRDCAACAEFAHAIPARSADLRAIAPPLTPLAAAGVFARVTAGMSSHTTAAGGGAGFGSGAIGTGATAGKVAGAALITKTAAAVAVLATTAAVSVVVVHAVRSSGHGGALKGSVHRATVGSGSGGLGRARGAHSSAAGTAAAGATARGRRNAHTHSAATASGAAARRAHGRHSPLFSNRHSHGHHGRSGLAPARGRSAGRSANGAQHAFGGRGAGSGTGSGAPGLTTANPRGLSIASPPGVTGAPPPGLSKQPAQSAAGQTASPITALTPPRRHQGTGVGAQ